MVKQSSGLDKRTVEPNLVKNIYFYLAGLLTLLLPLHPKMIPPAIILLAVCALFLFRPKDFVTNKTAWGFVAFYALHAIGLLYTQNMQEGKFDLEVKLSFIVFPLAVLPVMYLARKQADKIYGFFILGCMVALLVCLHRAFWNYTFEHWSIEQNLYNENIRFNFFLSSRFSYFMHPSYFSMYLCFALCILMMGRTGFLNHWALRLPLGILFVGGIVLLASKSGIVVLGILLAGMVFKFRRNKYVWGGLVAAALGFCVLFYVSDEFSARFKNVLSVFSSSKPDAASVESSEARVLVWESATSLIMQNPLIGWGTGDVRDKLMEKYQENGYTGVLAKKLNAHNQFLQTTVALGILGLAVLAFIFVSAFTLFRRSRSVMGILLLLILLANFFVESMLETQAGVIFFSFWILFEVYQTKTIETDKLSTA